MAEQLEYSDRTLQRAVSVLAEAVASRGLAPDLRFCPAPSQADTSLALTPSLGRSEGWSEGRRAYAPCS